jgi:hypothetical protein
MYQQLWGYKVEDKLHLRVRKQKGLITTDLECTSSGLGKQVINFYTEERNCT